MPHPDPVAETASLASVQVLELSHRLALPRQVFACEYDSVTLVPSILLMQCTLPCELCRMVPAA